MPTTSIPGPARAPATIASALVALACTPPSSARQPDAPPDPLRAVFVPEPVMPADDPALSRPLPPPARFPGKLRLGADGLWRPAARPAQGDPTSPPPLPRGTGSDRYLADGAETALSIDVGGTSLLLGTLNQGWFGTPSMMVSADGNNTWADRMVPPGSGTYNFFPFDPWTQSGNAAGELYDLFTWDDANPTFNTRAVIGRSANAGVSFSRFYEASNRISFQDRSMFDIDRTEALGGGPGTTHDGKAFLCFDDYGNGGFGYVATLVQVISTGGVRLAEVTVSTNAVFNGSQVQPVAGVSDGQVILNSNALTGTPGVAQMRFHLLTNTTTLQVNRSIVSYNQTGQDLGGSGYHGLNGFRINGSMVVDVDRSNGPRRGRVYLVSDRNPNRLNPALDQGDVHVAFSTNNAQTWINAIVPGQAAGKTQYFSMMDVDDNGWLHVAYYQNETGSVNGGVLNASAANLYYTFSKDGGVTWAPHVRVNEDANTLDFEDPPPDRAGDNYYLIGDYAQIKAGGRGIDTKVYVLWTGYDKDRSDLFVGDKRERAICTTVRPCLADFSRDGVVDSQDFFNFLNAFFAVNAQADFNGDGVVNSQDFFDFLTVFFAGCS